MARHNDISRAHALLEGEGWHIEGRLQKSTSNSTGKDRRHCKFYDKNSKTCEKLNYSPCVGVRKCPTYREQ